jgi:hypothetical protein
MALIFIYPPIVVIIYAGTSSLGYTGATPYCTVRITPAGALDIPLVFFYIPLLLIIISGTACLAAVLRKFLRVWIKLQSGNNGSKKNKVMAIGSTGESEIKSDSNINIHNSNMVSPITPAGTGGDSNDEHATNANADPSPSKKLMRKNLVASTTLLTFCLAFLGIWAVLFTYKLKTVSNAEAAKESYDTWTKCMFDNYDGVTDASAISVCGEQPDYYKKAFSSFLLAMIFGCGQSIIVSLVFGRQIVAPWMCCCGKSAYEEDREIVRILEIRAQQALLKLSNKSRNNGT